MLTFVFMGTASVFSQGAEFALMTGLNPREPDVVENYVDLVLNLFLPGAMVRLDR